MEKQLALDSQPWDVFKSIEILIIDTLLIANACEDARIYYCTWKAGEKKTVHISYDH